MSDSREFPRIQHLPCPACQSRRTVRTEAEEHTHTLHCPDCEHTWDVPLKPVARPVPSTLAS
jgi:hypothetical protein